MDNILFEELSLPRFENAIDVYIDTGKYTFVSTSVIPREMSDEILAFEVPNHLSFFYMNMFRKLKSNVDDIVLDDSDIYLSNSFARNLINPDFRTHQYSSNKTVRMFSDAYWIPMDFEQKPIVDVVYLKNAGQYLRTPEDWIAVRTDKRFAFSNFNKFYILVNPDLNLTNLEVGYIIAEEFTHTDSLLKQLDVLGVALFSKVMIPAFVHISVNNPYAVDVDYANTRLRNLDTISIDLLSNIIGQNVNSFRVVFRTLGMGKRIIGGSNVNKKEIKRYFGNERIVKFVLNEAYIE